MWTRDLKLKLWLISITGCAAFVLLAKHGMRFDYFSASAAVGTVGLLLPFAVVFDGRKISAFANLLTGFLCMVVFNLFLAILTYAGTPFNAPLADPWLMACDEAMGVHLPTIVATMAEHPTLRMLSNLAYASVFPSTLLALVVLGLDSDVRRLREFVLHFMVAGLITTACFFFLPAACPVGAYGYAATEMQQNFLDHFFSLRTGQFPVVSMNHLEGLITFPSFHTTWAVLVAYAFRHYRWLFAPMIVLNAAVAISTVTTGFHYATDVIGGIATAAIAVMICDRLAPWLQAGKEETLASLFGRQVVAN